MNPRVCICCGEAIAEKLYTLSRNPNLCASCSSLTDGMDDSAVWLMALKSTKSHKTFAAADSLHNQDGAVVVQ